MTAVKINRFSLSEIENVTIRCKRCGAGYIVRIDSNAFEPGKCPSCGITFGRLSKDIFEALRQARGGVGLAGDFDVEFDIVDKD
jgi:phage FluMu protein Com